MRTLKMVAPVVLAFVAFSAVRGAYRSGLGAASVFPAGDRTLSGREFVATRTREPLLFVSDFANSVVDIFLQSSPHTKVGQISGFSQQHGIATDASGNLYVADYGNARVPVFAPPYTGGAKLVLDDTGYFPSDVAVSASGLVAVANFCGSGSCQPPGNVGLYAQNAVQPCASVKDAAFANVSNAAFDHDGVLFVDGYDAHGRVVIGEVVGGCKARSIRALSTGNTIISPGGVAVDKFNQIVIEDWGAGEIYTYAHPRNGTLGTPAWTIALKNGGTPFALAFLASGHSLYIGAANPSVAREYAYPQGGAPEDTIRVPGGRPFGVAATPPLSP